MGHFPAFGSVMTEWTGHVHIDTKRTPTRFILQIGQAPGSPSKTSGCIGHVYDIGGRLMSLRVLAVCATVAAGATY